MNNERKCTRGGSRPGSGNKRPVTTTHVGFRLDNSLLDLVNAQANKSKYINACIKAAKQQEQERRDKELDPNCLTVFDSAGNRYRIILGGAGGLELVSENGNLSISLHANNRIAISTKN